MIGSLAPPIFLEGSGISESSAFLSLRSKLHTKYIATPNIDIFSGYPFEQQSSATSSKIKVNGWRVGYENPDLALTSKTASTVYVEVESPVESFINWLYEEDIVYGSTTYSTRYKALLAASVITSAEHDEIESQAEQTREFKINLDSKPNWATHIGLYKTEIPSSLWVTEVIEAQEIADTARSVVSTGTILSGTGLILGNIVIATATFNPIVAGTILVIIGIGSLIIDAGTEKEVHYDIDIEGVEALDDAVYKRHELLKIPDDAGDNNYDFSIQNTPDTDEVYLDARYNESPPANLRAIAVHAGRIYGVEGFTQNIVFSHIDGNGLSQWLAFPPQNQINTTSSGFTPVVALEQMPNKGGLYVFKRDAIHYIEGHNIFSGLYDISVGTQTDISAAASKKNIGCISPNSIINDGTMVLFVGSDDQIYALVDKTASPIGLSVKPFIQELTLTEQENISAQWHKERFYLTLKDSTLLLDTERKFWLRYDWELSDIQWDRGGASPESRLYGLTQDDEFVELNIDNEDETFSIMLETNKQVVPTGSLATAVYVYTEDNETLTVTVTGNEPYREVIREYRPRLGNKYRVGVHVKGRHITMKLECPTPISIDRIMIMETV